MGKHVKKIENMVGIAERNGSSVQGAYEVSYDSQASDYKLYHYGTLTAQVTSGRVVKAFGIGSSDADSVETFVNLLATDLEGFINFGYRPVNGGFYAGRGDVVVYQDDTARKEDFGKQIMEAWDCNQ